MKFEDRLNKIRLEDSYKLIKDIPNKSIDLVYIDIPYLLNQSRWWRSIWNKEKEI